VNINKAPCVYIYKINSEDKLILVSVLDENILSYYGDLKSICLTSQNSLILAFSKKILLHKFQILSSVDEERDEEQGKTKANEQYDQMMNKYQNIEGP
jgi:hypothetical protein